MSINSDRDSRFTSIFWPKLQDAFGTKLYFTITFHPQTDGQFERTIQTLEDLLRVSVLQIKGSWDKLLPLTEFSYNKSYLSALEWLPLRHYTEGVAD